MIRPFLTALLILLVVQPSISDASWSTILKKNGGNAVAKETSTVVESATQRQLRESAERSYINNTPQQQMPQRRAPSYKVSPDGQVTERPVVTKSIGPSLDDLSRTAGAIDKGGFTAAGRSLTKHGAGARPGNSLFPTAKGNPAAINRQAQDLVDDILTNPNTKVINSQRGRFGNTIEHVAPDGRGVVFDSSGKFLFFREGGL